MSRATAESKAPFPWESEEFSRPSDPGKSGIFRHRHETAAPEDSPALLDHPSKLFVEVTTRCNLSCRMCVKQSPGSRIRQGDMSREVLDSLLPALSGTRALILNGIGEPLLHPELPDFVRIAKDAMPSDGWVGFQTNGLLLDEPSAQALTEAGLDRICLSLDSVCRDTFGKIRTGAEVGDLDRAFASLAAARKCQPGSRLRVGVAIVLMRDNLGQLSEVLRWSADQGADFAIVTHLLPYHEDQIAQSVFDSNMDRAVALYHRWKKRAESEGIDLGSYFFINFYKFFRTPEEERVVDFVKEMVRDARDQDVFLHVRNLLARDEALAEEVGRALEEARAAARETGLDLLLPAQLPRENRRCDFIEGGSAMISWNGDVHPCYFLWHGYQCHFSYWRKYVPGLESPWGSSTALHFTNWRKTVNPRTFGNLKERGILEIWNDPGFLAFRREVLGNEFPYCANCNLVPCDHLTADEFDRDCFSSSVPCGDCFWALGLFNCLG